MKTLAGGEPDSGFQPARVFRVHICGNSDGRKRIREDVGTSPVPASQQKFQTNRFARIGRSMQNEKQNLRSAADTVPEAFRLGTAFFPERTPAR